eukprot:m.95929 g.95929  ORF g.95929 m.95929 type:complete len:1017 (-) comp16625_c0_seq2:77-3127(-)
MDISEFEEQLRAEADAREQERLWEDEHDEEMELLREMEDGPPAKRALVKGTVASSIAHIPTSSAASSTRAPPKSLAPSRIRKSVNPFESDSSDDDDVPPRAGSASTRPGKRARYRTSDSPTQNRSVASSVRTGNGQQVLTRQPVEPTTMFTAADGSRMYFRFDKTLGTGGGARTIHATSETLTKVRGNLLTEPFSHIRALVDQERRQSALASVQATAARLADIQSLSAGGIGTEALGDDVAKDAGAARDEDDMLPFMPSTQPETFLWVDKFSPKRYIDLVSDESKNRELLRWVKSWDKVVFGRGVKPHGTVPATAEKAPGPINPHAGAAGLDDTVPKIALVSGPPGVGKTTLAHVVARHCGYATVEVNASDDRSVQAFRTRIRNAVQMREVLSMENRPNCLVLDEIDGATKAAINVLITMLKSSTAGGKTADDADAAASKKKSKKNTLLRRPIICICNDIHAPALRALRKIALEIVLPPLSSSALTSRLSAVCRLAGVKAEARSLSALCDVAGGDIRSCLSTLQFSTMKTKRFTMDSMSEFLGHKDKDVGLFTVFDRIFTKRDSVRTLKRARIEGAKSSAQQLLHLVMANSQYDKLVEGCYENYLSVKGLGSFDPTMTKVTAVTDWMLFTDELERTIAERQTFALMGYLPYTVLAFHEQYASGTKQSVRFPRIMYNAKQQTQECQRVVATMLDECAPRVRRMLTERIVALDLVTPLLDLVTPAIRPVAPSLLSATEKAVLHSVIHTMIGYNLSYKQERVFGGTSSKYVLEPPLGTLVNFANEETTLALENVRGTASFTPSGSNARGAFGGAKKSYGGAFGSGSEGGGGVKAVQRDKRLTHNTRQLIVQALAQERLRLQDAALYGAIAPTEVPQSDGTTSAILDADEESMAAEVNHSGSANTDANTSTGPVMDKRRYDPEYAKKIMDGASAVPKTKDEKDAFLKARMGIQTSNIKQATTKSKAGSKDFFGREKKVFVPDMTPSQAIAQIKAVKTVFFKFQEGFSNAVKKPLRLRDLL